MEGVDTRVGIMVTSEFCLPHLCSIIYMVRIKPALMFYSISTQELSNTVKSDEFKSLNSLCHPQGITLQVNSFQQVFYCRHVIRYIIMDCGYMTRSQGNVQTFVRTFTCLIIYVHERVRDRLKERMLWSPESVSLNMGGTSSGHLFYYL